MADIRIGNRGGANLPPEDRQVNVSKECQTSIEHTKKVVERIVFTHFDSAKLNVTAKPPEADEINHLLFP